MRRQRRQVGFWPGVRFCTTRIVAVVRLSAADRDRDAVGAARRPLASLSSCRRPSKYSGDVSKALARARTPVMNRQPVRRHRRGAAETHPVRQECRSYKTYRAWDLDRAMAGRLEGPLNFPARSMRRRTRARGHQPLCRTGGGRWRVAVKQLVRAARVDGATPRLARRSPSVQNQTRQGPGSSRKEFPSSAAARESTFHDVIHHRSPQLPRVE